MRIVRHVHLPFQVQAEIALIARHACRQLNAGLPVIVLIQIEVEIAEVILVTARLLPDEQAIGNAQFTDVKGPAVAGGDGRFTVARLNRRALRFLHRAVRRSANNRVFQHHLTDAQLMRQQRPQIDVQTHIIGGHHRLAGAGRGQAHAARQNAELRPDVPAQVAAHLKLITTALFYLLYHIGTKVVGIDQQHQCRHARYDHH